LDQAHAQLAHQQREMSLLTEQLQAARNNWDELNNLSRKRDGIPTFFWFII
jgi:hypothetical protein